MGNHRIVRNLNDLSICSPRFLTDIYIKNVNLENIKRKDLYACYFSDHVINFDSSVKSFNLHLQRNDNLFYYVEKNASYYDKINALFPKFYKAPLPFYFAWDAKSLLCLNDSWSCLGWIDHFLSNNDLYQNEEIILIHFDSHSDMGNPLIGKHIVTSELYDLLRNDKINTNNIFDFFIALAIGSVGISNYISILPLFFKKVSVFYINQFGGAQGTYNYKLDFVKDELFKTCSPFLLRASNAHEYYSVDNITKYPHTRFETNSIKNCMDIIPKNKNIYLHFDMDYFNNWLGGSSEKHRVVNNMRSISQQYEEIDTVMSYLKKWGTNILHTSIGLSPGFFPSNYWVPCTRYLINALNKNGIHFSLKNVFPNSDII